MLKGERQTGRHPQVVQTHGGSMGETLPSVEVAVEVGATSAHPHYPELKERCL